MLTSLSEPPLRKQGPLREDGWRRWLQNHPDRVFVNTLVAIIVRGVKIGYQGPDQLLLNRPHPSAAAAPEVLSNDLRKQQENNRITKLAAEPTSHFISSPLGLVPKHGGGWRRIHDLSFPRPNSVNHYIDEAHGAIEYTLIDDAIDALIAQGRFAVMIKRDLADAFRHIPIAESDWWLLGFFWADSYYIDRFLPFGLRTAPFIFDLFAKALHWILVVVFLWAIVFHYLDDFFAILPLDGDAEQFGKDFDTVCNDCGLTVNHGKDQQGTLVEFLGLEFDSEKMEVRLPPDKLERARKSVADLLNRRSIPHSELESTVGLLAFSAKVVVPGRAFLRRLYDALAKKREYHHITSAMAADLRWWNTFLSRWNGIRLLRRTVDRPLHSLWTDASGKFGMGGYILGPMTIRPEIDDVFSLHFASRYRKKDIQFKEMLAVLVAIRKWISRLQSGRLTLYCDNGAVVDSIKNKSIRGPAMAPLRQIVMLFARYDIDVEVIWIPTKYNHLADLLSRFKFAKIADLHPQLKSLNQQGTR